MKLLSGVTLCRFCLVVAVLLVSPSFAQIADESQSDGQVPEATEQGTESAVVPVSPVGERSSFIYGGSAGQGFRVSHDADGTRGSAVTVLNPYFKLSSYQRSSDVVIGYFPLLVFSTQDGNALSSYHRATFIINQQLSHRWSWELSFRDGYGDEGARLLAEVQAGLSAQRLTDKELDLNNSARLNWRRTRRQQLSLAVGDSYFLLQPESESSNLGYARVDVRQETNPATTLIAFGQVHHGFDSACTLYGSGFGVDRHVSDKIDGRVQVGPEYGSSQCGLRWGLYYQASVRWEPTERTRLVLGARRDMDASYLAGSGQGDTFSVYFRERMSASTFVETDANYRSAADSSNGSTRSGYYLAAKFRWRMKKVAEFVGGYYYSDRGEVQFGEPGLRQSSVLFTLMWRPAAARF